MGTWKDSPSLPRPPPPPQLGSRHVVPGVGGGEKRRDFLGAPDRQQFLQSEPPTPETLRSARESERGERRPAVGSPGAGDAGAARGTCGSSRRRRAPRRQRRGLREVRQPQPPRPAQYPPRPPPRRHLPAPGPAAPGGCGSSASQQRFAGSSCFKVRRRGWQPRQERAPLLPPAPASLGRPVLRRGCPAGVRRHLVPRGVRWESLQVPRCWRGGRSRGFAGLELQTLDARAALSEELGRREGPSAAGASSARKRDRQIAPSPAKLSGVSSNPWEWRRRQVSGARGSLRPGRAPAVSLRSERDQSGAGRGEFGDPACLRGSGES